MVTTSKIIVALDVESEYEALQLVDALDPKFCALKVGSVLFTRLGSGFIKQLIARQFSVFLDLKFHDIPNTVAKACVAAADLGVWMLTLHASGGVQMMQAAQKALQSYGSARPYLIAVTVLTSMSQDEVKALGVDESLPEHVARLALSAKEAGLDGVVSSAQEAASIKALCGDDFLVVTPGIRLLNDDLHDQTRVVTPEQALRAGSDFLVVGRSITLVPNPQAVLAQLLSLTS